MNKDQVNEMINYAHELALKVKWSIKGDGYDLTINNQTFNTYEKCKSYLDSIG